MIISIKHVNGQSMPESICGDPCEVYLCIRNSHNYLACHLRMKKDNWYFKNTANKSFEKQGKIELSCMHCDTNIFQL